MIKLKKSMVIIPVAFTSVLTVAVATSCSGGANVNYEINRPIGGIAFREENTTDYSRSIKTAGIITSTTDLIALYQNIQPYPKAVYEKLIPGGYELAALGVESEKSGKIKALQGIKDGKLPGVPENKELLYFISRGSNENFVDAVLLTADKKLIINYINRIAISKSRSLLDPSEITSLTLMTIPKSNYSGIEINEIRTMAEFKRYKKDTPFSSYTKDSVWQQRF